MAGTSWWRRVLDAISTGDDQAPVPYLDDVSGEPSLAYMPPPVDPTPTRPADRDPGWPVRASFGQPFDRLTLRERCITVAIEALAERAERPRQWPDTYAGQAAAVVDAVLPVVGDTLRGS